MTGCHSGSRSGDAPSQCGDRGGRCQAFFFSLEPLRRCSVAISFQEGRQQTVSQVILEVIGILRNHVKYLFPPIYP